MRSPAQLVGSQEYIRELDEQIRRQGFPQPDPELIQALTEARHVAAEAEAVGEDAFAEEVRSIRQAPFDALRRFGYVMQGKASGSPTDEETIRTQMTPRERTFMDFPGPAPQFVGAAEDRGLEDFEEELPDADVDGDGRDAKAAAERRSVAAVVAGGAAIAEEFYDEVSDGEPPSGIRYRSREEYVDVAAFNAGLVADGMLEAGRGSLEPIPDGPPPGAGGMPTGGPGGPAGPGTQPSDTFGDGVDGSSQGDADPFGSDEDH